MHIKTLTIQGFKSYRDQVAVDPFSPKHNVVVGRNGSGKSNFFSAIRFVLGDMYQSMGREERSGLLHEGTGLTATLSAYVEIVFDNTDGRFPSSSDELLLRRTIGMKKDEYSIDRKSASKAEVMNLLESAGFSRSNPYYIVPQGRVTTLTNMRDPERLDLFKEIAGTNIYDQRRAESVKIIEETTGKQEKIAELLEKIEERLKELEQEKAELKDYQEKDKDRRCLEYALFERELADVEGALEVAEDERRRDIDGNNEKRTQFEEREAEIKRLQTELGEANHRLAGQVVLGQQSNAELTDLIKAKTELECQIDDLQQSGANSEQKKQDMKRDLQEVERRIGEIDGELMNLVPNWEDKLKEERELKKSLEQTQGKLDSLYAKQGRSGKFRNKTERDAFLKQEIAAQKALKDDAKQRMEEITKQLITAEVELSDLKRSAADVEQDLEAQRKSLSRFAEEVEAKKVALSEKIDRRKTLWHQEGKLKANVASAKEQKDKLERELAGMMDKDTKNGLQAVKNLSARLKLNGVYGPLYSLFEVDAKYKTAVEVTAGNSLFHVVCDTDATVSKVLEIMSKERLGRVTFMPLNRLRKTQYNHPQAEDAIPMIGKINFDKKYTLAFEQVFGSTIICQDLKVAGQYTRSHGVNAITLDGDRVDRKGSLTGGYHDTRRSRLDAVKTLMTWGSTVDHDTRSLEGVRAELDRVEQEITIILGNIEKLQSDQKRAQDARQPLLSQLNRIRKEEGQISAQIERQQWMQSETDQESTAIDARLEAMTAEMRTAFTQTLTDAEQAELPVLAGQIDDLQKRLAEVSAERASLGSKKRMLDIEVNEGLRRRKEELRNQLENYGLVGGDDTTDAADVDARKAELAILTESIEELQGSISDIEAVIEEVTKQVGDINSRLDELNTQQLENSRGILKAQKSAERYLHKRQTLLQRQEEVNKSIRDLGVLPEDAFTKYVKDKPEKLIKQIHKVNHSLKEYTNVNKKALEQYSTFTRQRDALIKRNAELEVSGESIQELIDTLDKRKDEAIERTFKQVSKYFSEVFEKLVPAGKGRLKMQKDLEEDDPMNGSSAPRKTGINSYVGVGIEVSFNSKVDEGLRIQQLSGGQKSLVALATVFAIQKCDPAPFYLFDEIDANLDAQYRTAVADMIHELSSTAQFITTTFRPEMLAHADKFYGVIFDANKVSSIRTIERENAQEFVDVSV